MIYLENSQPELQTYGMKKLLELNILGPFFYLELLLNSHMNTMKMEDFWFWTASHSLIFLISQSLK
jgi:hypothetical protein